MYKGDGNYIPAPAGTYGNEWTPASVKDRTHCQLWEDDWLAWERDSKTTTEWAVGIHPQPLWTEHHAQRAVGTHKRMAVR